jgi:hypothetical protein
VLLGGHVRAGTNALVRRTRRTGLGRGAVDGSAVIVRRAPGSQRPVGTVGTGGLVTVHGKLNASDGFTTPGERVEFRGGESPHKHLAGRLPRD